MVHFSSSFAKMLTEIKSESRLANIIVSNISMLDSSEVDYLTMRGQMISYLPNGREHKVNEEGKWSRDGRQEGKPTRILRKICLNLFSEYNITDSDFEKLAYLMTAYTLANGDDDNPGDAQIKLFVCNGMFIGHYYHEDNYSPEAGGNLVGSCMREADKNLFEIYESNPDSVSMIVALDGDGLVLGRALLWKTTKGRYCMDTIYAQDHIRPIFIDFAVKNDIRYKSQQSCHWNLFDKNTIESDKDLVAVSLRYSEFDSYPFLDTMSYLDDDDTLWNCSSNLTSGKILRDTHGGYEDIDDDRVECIVSGDMYDENDCLYVEYHIGGRYICGYAHVNEVWDTPSGYRLSSHTVELNDGTRHASDSDDIIYVERECAYFLHDEVIIANNGDAIPEDQAVQLENGDYAHIEDAIQRDGIWYLTEEIATQN